MNNRPKELRPALGPSPLQHSKAAFVPAGGQAAATARVAATGKFPPIGSQSTGKFAPVDSSSARPSPVASTGKFAAPRAPTPPPLPAQKSMPTPLPGKQPVAAAAPARVRPSGAFPKPAPGQGSTLHTQPPPAAAGARLSMSAMSGNLSVGRKQGAKAASQWCCVRCGTALGPQAVVQGTGTIIDGSLFCVACVKSSRRKIQPQFNARIVLAAVAALAGVLGVIGIFLPSQALLIALLLSAAAVLVGLIGFTLSTTARLGTIAAALMLGIACAYGFLLLNGREATKAAEGIVASETDTIKDDLKANCYNEALRHIDDIEQRARKAGGGILAPHVQKHMDDLRALTDQWLTDNFGNLNPKERTLLIDLYKQFGSLTASQAPQFKSVHISGNSVQVTMVVDPPRSARTDRTHSSGDTAIDQTRALLIFLLRRSWVENLEIKVALAPKSGELKDLYTFSVDDKAIVDFRRGNTTLFEQILDGQRKANR